MPTRSRRSPAFERSATARLQCWGSLAAMPPAPGVLLIEPAEEQRLLSIDLFRAYVATGELPDVDELADRIVEIRGFRRTAVHTAHEILGRLPDQLRHEEEQHVKSGIDHALAYLRGRIGELLTAAREHVEVLGDVRIDDTPPPPPPGSVNMSTKTVNGFTPVWRRPGTRVRPAAATAAQRTAWDALGRIASEYRAIRSAQARLVRDRLDNAAQALRLAGEFSNIVQTWPDWDISDTPDAEPAPWGEHLPHGIDAGPDFIAWWAIAPAGSVWLPTLRELQEAAEEPAWRPPPGYGRAPAAVRRRRRRTTPPPRGVWWTASSR